MKMLFVHHKPKVLLKKTETRINGQVNILVDSKYLNFLNYVHWTHRTISCSLNALI